MRKLVLIAVVLVGCKSKGPDPKAVQEDVARCQKSHANAVAGAGSATQEQREMQLGFAVGDCSSACGLGDKASCPTMEADMRALCATKPDWCVTVCHSTNNWENATACAIAGLPAPK